MNTKSVEVLVVGAGPTGLALALFLQRQGVQVRIIDRNSGPGQQSRAMVVQARTLEFYAQLGFADEVVSRGYKMETICLREGNKRGSSLHFGDFGKGLSPYPFALSFPQDDHERILGEKLRQQGISVDWDTELTSFRDAQDGVTCKLRGPSGEEELACRFLCGCDGVRSTVRESLGLGFPGGTYEQLFFVADVKGNGPGTEGFSISLVKEGFCTLFPIRSSGMYRIIGIVSDAVANTENLQFEDVRQHVEQLLGIRFGDANWFSTYHVHHRVSEKFRVGNVFLAGDAGHIHSPVGGQGMNTGIGDAVNLAWKMGGALQGRLAPEVLDTFEEERIAFAKSLVATTDRLFQTATSHSLGSELVRSVLLPHLMPIALGFTPVQKMMFGFISETKIEYPDSPLSRGETGVLQGGNRLPWVAETDNFAPLTTLEWQVHIYGSASEALKNTLERHCIRLYEFRFTDDAREAGLVRDALYLIRPDGYIGLVCTLQDTGELDNYLRQFSISGR